MKISRFDAQYILERFGVDETVLSWSLIQEHLAPGRTRLIYSIVTEEGGRWICRLTDDSRYPRQVIERQSIFAALLYQYGVPAPFNLRAGDRYCLDMKLGRNLFGITLETAYGKDLDYANIDTFYLMGKLLGKMHTISENHPVKIGFSTVFCAIRDKQADLASVFQRQFPQFLKDSRSRVLVLLHNSLVNDLRDIWDTLPRGAVHGDLGVFNNLMEGSRGLGVIDFNLAGDEVYLGDLLVTFYSSVHKYTWRDRLSAIGQAEALEAFLSGYGELRGLTSEERDVFPEVSALFDGLFYCKSIIEEYCCGKDSYILDKFNRAPGHFSVSRHLVPQGIL